MVNGMKLNRKGFTLVELIVVIAIIGILSAVLVPSYVYFTEKADKAAVASEADQIKIYYEELELNGDLVLDAGETVDDLKTQLAGNDAYVHLLDEIDDAVFTFNVADSVVTGFTYENNGYKVTYDGATNSLSGVVDAITGV